MENLFIEKVLRRLSLARASTRRLLITGLGIAVVVASVCVFLLKPPTIIGQLQSSPRPAISLGGSVGVDSCRFLTCSADGSLMGAISAKGLLRVFNWQGKPVFSTPLGVYNRAVLVPGGKFTLVYSYRDPTHTRVSFLDASGRERSSLDVRSAVWSADAALTDDGARFAIGTGGRQVYVVDISSRGRRYKRWRVPGVAVSVSMDADGQQVNYGCWQRSVVGCADWNGDKRWEEDTDSQMLNDVERLCSSRTACRLVPNRAGSTGTLWIVRGDGEKLWETEIGQGNRPGVVVAGNGRYICRSYSKAIRHKRTTVIERHGVLVESPGRILWDKGSLFFQADPLLVTSGGYVVVVGSENRLYVVSRTGEVKPALKLSSQPRLVVPGKNGTRLVVYCSDGSIYMLELTEQQPRHNVEAVTPTRLG